MLNLLGNPVHMVYIHMHLMMTQNLMNILDIDFDLLKMFLEDKIHNLLG